MIDVIKKIRDIGIVPVVKLDSSEQAVPLGRALIGAVSPL